MPAIKGEKGITTKPFFCGLRGRTIAQMKALFRLRQFSMCCRRLDVDKSGVIDASELRRGLRAVGCENPTEMGFRGDSFRRSKRCCLSEVLWWFPLENSVSTSLSLHFFGMAGASPPVFVDRNPLILLLDVQLSNHFDAIFLQWFCAMPIS